MTTTYPMKEFAHLCHLAGDHGPEHFLGRPHRMEHKGVVWSFVTDAHHVLLYKGVDIYADKPADQIQFYPGVDKATKAVQFILGLINNPPEGAHTVSMATLREWAGEPAWPRRDGMGDPVDGLWPERLRLGRINRTLVDLTRVARLLDGLPGDASLVKTSGRSRLVRFDGDGWIAAVMPCIPQALHRPTVIPVLLTGVEHV